MGAGTHPKPWALVPSLLHPEDNTPFLRSPTYFSLGLSDWVSAV